MRTIRRAFLLIASVLLVSAAITACDGSTQVTTTPSTTQPVTESFTVNDAGIPSGGYTKTAANPDTYSQTATIFNTDPVDYTAILKSQDVILSRRNNKKPYNELITKTVDLTEFIQKINPNPHIVEFQPFLYEIDEKVGIECLRKSKTGNYYSVHKLKQGGLLYIFYYTRPTGDCLFMYNWFASQKSLSDDDFSSIAIGSSLEEVENIDPVTVFYKLRASAYESKPTSFYSQHYLTDGILTIY